MRRAEETLPIDHDSGLEAALLLEGDIQLIADKTGHSRKIRISSRWERTGNTSGRQKLGRQIKAG
jgi:hypothetical protein